MGFLQRFFPFWKDGSRSETLIRLNLNMSASGELVSPDTALTESTVYSCVRLIASNAGTLPLAPYQKTPTGRKRLDDSKLYYLFSKSPNPRMTAAEWKQATLAQMLLYGNSFSYIDRLGQDVIGIWLLPPDQIKVTEDQNGNPVYNINGKSFSADQILHFKNFSVDGLTGLSVIEYHRHRIGASLASTKFSASMFRNQATPSGVLKYPGALSPEAKKRLQDAWNASNAGPDQAAKTILLEDGLEWQPISMKPADLEYIQTRKLTALEICAIFGVPAHMLNLNDKPTYASVESMGLEFLNYTLRPYLVIIEQTLDQKFFPNDSSRYWQFNTKAIIRADIKTRYESYKIALNNGWMSVNEVRELEELDQIPNGDTYFYPLNMGKLGETQNEN
jgi:HK97 family phage portal protein